MEQLKKDAEDKDSKARKDSGSSSSSLPEDPFVKFMRKNLIPLSSAYLAKSVAIFSLSIFWWFNSLPILRLDNKCLTQDYYF